MKKNFFFFLLSTISVLTFAQTKNGIVTGSINGNDNKPLEAATVLLLKQKDSSIAKTSITDKQGQYSFNKIANGKYFVSVSAQGYKNLKTDLITVDSINNNINLPTINLILNEKSLTGVTVVSQKPFIERKIDKLVINVASSPMSAGQSAYEILEKSPGVTIDENDNISLVGKAGVMIFIDGKPSYLAGRDLTSFLRGLPASQLDQLEIMTQPPARYDASGDAGIINFKTKKNQANGFNGSISTAAIFSAHFKTRNSIALNWKKNKFNFSANYSYAALKNYSNQHIEREFRNNSQTNFNRYLDQDARLVWSQYPHNAKLAMDYYASKTTTFGIVLSGSFSNNYQNTPGFINISDSLHNLIQYTNYITSSKNPVSNPGINFNLQQKFSKGKELTADADYIYYHNPASQSSYNYAFDKDSNPLESVFLQNRVPLNINIYSFKSDYSQPLKDNAKLEAGIKISDVKTDDDVHYSLFNQQQGKWLPDTGRTTHFLYEENINAAYVSLNKEFNKKWSLQTGLRLEQTNSNGNEVLKKSHFKRNYANLFPSVYLNYKQDEKNNFTISYDRRINRPSYQFLNPFQSVIDQFTFQQGNPLLKPIMTDNIEFSYDHAGQVNVTLNYTMTHRLFSPFIQTIKQGNNYITMQTPVNVASRRNVGIDINYHKPITKWWNTNVDIHFFNNRINDVIDSSKVIAGITIFFVTISNQFPLKKGWTFDLSGFYRTKRLEGFPVYAIPGGAFSFGVSKKIKTRATITMNVNDPFRLLKGGIMTNRETFSFHTTNRNENRYVTFTVSYRFGKAMQQQTRRNHDTPDEQNRL